MNRKKTDFLVHGALIAAVYVALTMMFAPISFGPVQFRISEALCILPFFTPAAVPGLFLGCLISNLLGTAVLMDVICGSIATLIGAAGSYALRHHKRLVCLPYPGKYPDHPLGAAVCLRFPRSDPFYDAHRRDWRDFGRWGSGKWPLSYTGAL